MKEKPLLFNAPMVRATLDGSKTMTRRIMNPQPQMVADKSSRPWEGDPHILMKLMADIGRTCPYGKPGDRLWAREAWQFYDWSEDGDPCIRYAADNATAWPKIPEGESLVDTWEILSRPENYNIDNHARDRRWRPSIHMPRWASRINLEITGVRVERLSAISEADAIAEGVSPAQGTLLDDDLMVSVVADKLNVSYPVARFVLLWDSINGKFPNNWNANPWVWVISYKRI